MRLAEVHRWKKFCWEMALTNYLRINSYFPICLEKSWLQNLASRLRMIKFPDLLCTKYIPILLQRSRKSKEIYCSKSWTSVLKITGLAPLLLWKNYSQLYQADCQTDRTRKSWLSDTSSMMVRTRFTIQRNRLRD